MEVTEQQRHQLFVWFEERMGPERAATMMELIPPVGSSELASKDDLRLLKRDLVELEGRIDVRFAQLESGLTRSFVTWLLASQATVVTVMVGLVVSIR